VRLVLETEDQCPTRTQAMRSIAAKLGIGSVGSLRNWVRRAEVDAGRRPGTTTEEPDEVKRLRREVAELRRANEILKAAASFFAAEFDRPHPRPRTSSTSTGTASAELSRSAGS
jgi:transposase